MTASHCVSSVGLFPFVSSVLFSFPVFRVSFFPRRPRLPSPSLATSPPHTHTHIHQRPSAPFPPPRSRPRVGCTVPLVILLWFALPSFFRNAALFMIHYLVRFLFHGGFVQYVPWFSPRVGFEFRFSGFGVYVGSFCLVCWDVLHVCSSGHVLFCFTFYLALRLRITTTTFIDHN